MTTTEVLTPPVEGPVRAPLRPASRFIQIVADDVRVFKDHHQLSQKTMDTLVALLLVVDYRDASIRTTITALAEYREMNRRTLRGQLDELTEVGAVRWTPGIGTSDGVLQVLAYDQLVNAHQGRVNRAPAGQQPRAGARELSTSARELSTSARELGTSARLTRTFDPLEVEVEEEPTLPPQSAAAGPPHEPTSGGEEVLLRNDEHPQDQALELAVPGGDPVDREELLELVRSELERADPAVALRWDAELRAKPLSVTSLVTALGERRAAGAMAWDLRLLAGLVVRDLPPVIETSLIGLLAARVKRLPIVPGGPSPAPAKRAVPVPSHPPAAPDAGLWRSDAEPLRWQPPPPRREREPDPERVTCRHCEGRFHPRSMATADACRDCAPVGAGAVP